MKVSIIIPVLNEVSTVGSLLEALQPLRLAGHEVIIIDGGSQDDTVEICKGKVDKILHSTPGRAAQMNLGAQESRGEKYWFLHADTRLLYEPAEYITHILSTGSRSWGWFPVRLSSGKLIFGVIGTLMNLRSRFTSIATGDQGMFVTKYLFDEIGGFPRIPLMEDIRFSSALKKVCKPVIGQVELETSSRRWEKRGILRTILLMWYLRMSHYLGADPKDLARKYSR